MARGRGRVGKVLSSYAGTTWFFLQFLDIAIPLLNLADWVLPLALMVALVGFHIVLAVTMVSGSRN